MAFVKNPYVIGLIISVALDILSFIFYKLCVNHKDVLIKLAKVCQRIPDYLIEAEQVIGAGKGEQKKLYALHLIRIVCSTFGIDYDKYEAGFMGEIERILATPQKHENVDSNENA